MLPHWPATLPHPVPPRPAPRAQAASHGNNKARIFISRVFMLLGHDTEAAGYKVHLAFQNFRYAAARAFPVEAISIPLNRDMIGDKSCGFSRTINKALRIRRIF